MTVPSRQIGWGPQENLLQYISKQLENMYCQLCKAIIPGPPGPPGAVGGYYGTFVSLLDQSTTVNTVTPFRMEDTYLSNGITVVNDTFGYPTIIQIAHAGVYNVALSAQFHYTGGGGAGQEVNIWIKRNGVSTPYTDRKLIVPSNAPYVIAAFNIFIDVPIAGGTLPEEVQVVWVTDNASIVLEAETPIVGGSPGIVSVAVTVNQVG